MIGEETMDISQHRQCSNCGCIFQEERRASCPDCSVPLRPDGTISGTLIQSKATREQAMDAVRNLLFYKHVFRALGFRYDFPECSLRYAPFWRFRAYVAGRVDGYIDEGGETPTMVPVRRYFSQTLTWTGIANDRANVGVRYLRNTTGEETPPDALPGPAPILTTSREDATTRGSIAMKKYAIQQLKKENLDRRKISDIELSPRETTLIYYPLWMVKYSYSNLVFRATVDGVTGELLAGGKVDDCLSRCAIAGILMGIFFVLTNIIFLINVWIGYALLLLITGLGHGTIVELLAFIRYGRAIAGDRLQDLFRLSRKTKCRRNGLAMLGVAGGFILMAFSITGLAAAFVTFYLLANQGLALYLASCLFLCDMSDRIIGDVREAR